MIILGVETSCDDTAVALIEAKNGTFRILKETQNSQIGLHKKYGGVVPEVAARAHSDLIMLLVKKVLGTNKPDIIAVTAGPGLITALLVGVQTGAALSYAWHVPLVAINHIEGHIYSNWLRQLEISDFRFQISELFPKLCLIVSGGHTELILMKDHGKYELIGRTRDDAAGEAFDKVGKLLGFDYPGGPKISKAAEGGDPNAIPFPRPMLDKENYDFSFAGLKTAAFYWLRDNAPSVIPSEPKANRGISHLSANETDDVSAYGRPAEGWLRLRSASPRSAQDDDWHRHFCASFQQAIVDTLVTKTLRAAQEFKPKYILLGGGVAANQALRDSLTYKITTNYPDITLTMPPISATMDNAAMIAVAGYFNARRKNFTAWNEIKTDPNWRIEDASNA